MRKQNLKLLFTEAKLLKDSRKDMDAGFSSLIIIFGLSVLFQCLQTADGHRKFMEIYALDLKKDDHEANHLRFRVRREGDLVDGSRKDSSLDNQMDPALKVFFHYNELKLGGKMSIYFPTKDPSTTPRLLSRDESDSIPFASSKLSQILNLFDFPEDSKQAKAIKSTLHHCEFPPLKGETKFCATSLESLLDSVHEIFQAKPQIKVLTTNYLSDSISSLQNYTISEHPVEISAPRIVACHMLPYPYAVFYCHSQESDNMLYKVILVGEDGARVAATAMCHMDTSQWDPSHVSFRVLGTQPGLEPVCHFFPADNLVWIPGSN